jgi:hypothetical protein
MRFELDAKTKLDWVLTGLLASVVILVILTVGMVVKMALTGNI